MKHSINFGGAVTVPALVIPTFPSVINAEKDAVLESSSVLISGNERSVLPITVRGDGDPQLQVSGGEWAQHVLARNGDSLKVRMLSSSTGLTSRSATIYGEGATSEWTLTTAPVFEELMVNSTFDTASGFSLMGNWSISGGQLIQSSATTTSEYAITSLNITDPKDTPMQIIADVASTGGDAVQFRLGGGDGGTTVITQVLNVGINTIDTFWTGTTNAVLIRIATVGAAISFNSISIKERAP